jgi:hypothetical protein
MRMSPCLFPLSCLVLAGVLATPAPAQETKKPDDRSAEVVLRGCGNGRVLVPMLIEGNVPTPVALIGRPVRLNGKRALIREIEKQKSRLIEVTGLVRRSDMQPEGPSTVVGNTRVTVGGSSPTSRDPLRADPMRQAMTSVVHMDVTGFRVLEDACPAR